MLDAVRILELANKAYFLYFLYVKQPPTEKAKLLNLVLSNCSIDAASVYPTYRKPFDLIFARAKNEEWRAGRDSNPDLLFRSHFLVCYLVDSSRLCVPVVSRFYGVFGR